MSGTLVNVRIVIQNVRIIGQSEVEKVKASGSSAAGVRIVSGWVQDRHRLVSGSLPKVSGSSAASVRIVTQNVRIVTQDVRIVSGWCQDSHRGCQDCQQPPSGLSAASVRIVSGRRQGQARLLGEESEALAVSVRIVSGQRQDCQRLVSGLSPRMSGLSAVSVRIVTENVRIVTRRSGLSSDSQTPWRSVSVKLERI